VAIYPSEPLVSPSNAIFPSGSAGLATSAPAITYAIRALWPLAASTAVQFDLTTFGEDDKFADPLSADFTAPEVDIIGGVESVSIKRGRDDNLDAFSMGECSITINDQDGRYNPANVDGPLYGLLRPMRQMLVEATVAGLGTVTLFRGFIRSIDHNADPHRKTTTFALGDLFLYMGKTRPVFTNKGSATTTGEVVGVMMTAMGVTAETEISTGDVIPSPGVGNSSTGETALGKVQQLLEIERGEFFVSGPGVPIYRSRYFRDAKALTATFKNVSADLIVATDLERVKNKATVQREGFSTSEWSDGVSIAAYGQQDFSAISSPYLVSGAQALSLAQWLVSQRSSPLSVFRGITLIPKALETAGAQYALTAEIGDRIMVENTSVGQPVLGYFVESVAHQIDPLLHKVRLSLTPIFNEIFLLDTVTATLDTGILAY